ncbi:hypothetical protein MCOR27_011747 [Pyricularia oryzae]|uniref:Uncharacterized protein n=4 Tax=Pyricularia oryzae TaxID=318829 RepID=G4MUC1_PYRO7|nr:uncharacterized protein MGG_15744 [Pyricularia oryzae 70-15]ELQ43264.1 hypothetical protein OOU_Y34scaffold00162g33 [Pyricularia oryzae Y34]KAH8839036.1 hypothetical protein MCOR01_008273 [Pyricularia oryzae]EHA54808.1 hypothetical protein MGG_15744 [Pyricularia oryzae 70-15]KAH9438874.1 hypothetical protein MCOR02_002471 [Pyricularia oryzae]KAI6259431.1 hypothetical protein MCOR19_004262 [Pyricularia oryzae]
MATRQQQRMVVRRAESCTAERELRGGVSGTLPTVAYNSGSDGHQSFFAVTCTVRPAASRAGSSTSPIVMTISGTTLYCIVICCLVEETNYARAACITKWVKT